MRGNSYRKTYDTMEFGSLVTLRSTLGILCFSSAKLTEIFGSTRGSVVEKLYFDAAQRFA
jgi:hypothetical protein